MKNEDNHHKASHFHSLKVKDIIKETADCVSVAFEIPEDLKYDFEFVAGQNLTLRADINGEDVRRSYSLCSAPYQGEVRVAIKKVENGVFSTWANESLKVGDEMQVMTPVGSFVCHTEEANADTYVGVAAGSGITPVISILKAVLNNEPQSKFILFYGNKNAANIIFREELEDLKNRYMDRLEVHHILSREDQGSDITFGRIDADKIKYFADNFFTASDVKGYFICGPQEMTEVTRDTLTEMGVDKHNIHFELFTAAAPAADKAQTKAEESSDVKSAVTVILDGDQTHFDIKSRRPKCIGCCA